MFPHAEDIQTCHQFSIPPELQRIIGMQNNKHQSLMLNYPLEQEQMKKKI